MRIIHILRVAIEQGVAGQSSIQGDRERNSGLAWVTRSKGVLEPCVNVLAGPKQMTIHPHEIKVFDWTPEPIIDNRRKISRGKVSQTGYPVHGFYGRECRHVYPLRDPHNIKNFPKWIRVGRCGVKANLAFDGCQAAIIFCSCPV